MTAFYDLPWPASDHRGLFIDINVIGLFGATLHSIPTLLPRKITSKSMKSCNRFIQQIIKSNKVPSLLLQINKLSQIHQWNQIKHKLIDELDSTFTTMLLQAEALVALPSNNFWNEELHNKYIIYTYWVTIIKGLKNRRDVSSQLQKLKESNPTIDMHQANPNRSAQKQLQHARKDLIEARTKSFNNRQVFLDHLQEKRLESGDTGRAHIINQIKKSEKRKQTPRTSKLLRQEPKLSGGISHVLIPTITNDGNSFQGKDRSDLPRIIQLILHEFRSKKSRFL
jgi:hypothetical protein